MKKHLLLFSFLIGSFVAVSQPTITSAVVPTVGHVMNYHVAQYINPGSAGTNQTWNFSSLASTSTKNYTVGLPSATPYAASFPNASFQINDGTEFEFFSTTSNVLSSEGVVDNIGTQPNTDKETAMVFPSIYTTTFSDSWGGMMTVSSISGTRTANTNVMYDGYGTLTTPAGTFTNVTRFHVFRDISDATSFLTVTRAHDEYRFYSPSYMGSLLTIYTRTSSVAPAVTGSMYQAVAAGPVGVSEYSKGNSVIVAYPNPASDVLKLEAVMDRAVNVEFFDFQGRMLYSEKVPEGESPVELNVSELAEGLYFVRVYTVNGRIENKKVLIRH
jgi:hypothetical protein